MAWWGRPGCSAQQHQPDGLGPDQGCGCRDSWCHLRDQVPRQQRHQVDICPERPAGESEEEHREHDPDGHP